MCPRLDHARPGLNARQAGFLLPVAAFILVVMGFLAATIARNSAQNTVSSVQEGISIQAFFAAESGVQQAMSRLFLLNTGPTRASVDAACTALNVAPEPELTFAVSGLNNCTATLSCSRSIDGADTTSYFRVVSVGSCGSGDIAAVRTVEVASSISD